MVAYQEFFSASMTIKRKLNLFRPKLLQIIILGQDVVQGSLLEKTWLLGTLANNLFLHFSLLALVGKDV